MNASIYLICQIIVLVLVFGLLAAVFFALRYALRKMHVKAEKRQQLQGYVIGGFLFWLTILAVGASSGFFSNFEVLPPRLFLALMPPVLIVVWLMFSRLFGVILKSLPEKWLISIQGFRILMEFMLWLGLLGGFVPIQMTFEGLNFDIIVGVTAIMAGFVFFGRDRYRKPEAVIWNIFGIVLLLNILMIALFSAPTPFRAFLNEPSNTFVANFPFIWVPGFIVPFALAMHLFSLRQLALSKQANRFFDYGRFRKGG